MDQKIINTFEQGMNLNLSDMVMPNKIGRYNLNMRMINLLGSSFVLSNILGNDTSFGLTAGFKPYAAQEFNGVLYIVSWNETTEEIELGSYPSPGTGIYQYRPLANLNSGGPFRTTEFEISTPPVIQKLEIQPDYDQSVNMIFTIVGKIPRIVNTKFKVNKEVQSLELIVIPDRPGSANSNTYTTDTVDKETSLILFTDKMLKISLGGITGGGKVKCGNYTYVFQYMTEDFNKTAVIGQSSVCQVAFGNTVNDVYGGDETMETNKRVVLNLTNVDTDFKYFKVYALYSAGQEALVQQTLEFTQAIPITGTTMSFNHTGYEELAEVSADTVNVDYSAISSAYASTQIGGYYMLGGISQRSYDFTAFKDAAATITPTFRVADLPTGVLPDYADPANVYSNLAYMGGESYPFGVVFVLPGNVLSPAFPVKGKIFDTSGAGSSNDEYPVTPLDQADGIVTFPLSSVYRPYKNGKVRTKYLEFDLSTVPDAVKNASLGFFFVRGERIPWAITQGVMIPTLAVPPIEWVKHSEDNGVYEKLNKTDPSKFRRVPLLDNLLEAYGLHAQGTTFSTSGTDIMYVMNNDLIEDPLVGRMGCYINDLQGTGVYLESGGNLDNIPQNDWAFYSGDALVNEPAFVASLRRSGTYIHQLGKANFIVRGQLPTLKINLDQNFTLPPPNIGFHYDFDHIDNGGYTAGWLTNFKKTSFIDYVLSEVFSTGSKFISRMNHQLYGGKIKITLGGTNQDYLFYLKWNSYFGVEMTDPLIDNARSALNPISGNNRINPAAIVAPTADTAASTSGTVYDNVGSIVPGAFLVNIYSNNQLPYTFDSTIGKYRNNFFPNIDTITYRQCSPWYTWGDLPVSGPMANRVAVYGGDTYVSKVTRKLYQSGFRDPTTSGTEITYKKANMPNGHLMSWYQEGPYNLYLRQPKLFDASEPEKRSFFPFKSRGDFNLYQQYRLPETVAQSPGYAEDQPPKSFFVPPSEAPFIENEFFSRIAHSERHIPNAFKNGYRSFLQTAYRDYDSSMGRIVALFNHRGKLLIVFQHGIGITDISQRIQTGSDAGGAIFVEPQDVLPNAIQYVTREIGCQDNFALVQTPSAVYGVDRSKDKFWKFSDTFKVISDDVVSSFILGNIVNPRIGYDFQYLEVLFTTDNWTLCFREGLEAFTSFYSFQPDFYARRTKEMYSFLGSQAWLHNAPNYTIYGENKNAIVEFVVNTGLQTAKVLDYLNIISNEVPPSKVEFYTYNQDVQIGETIQVNMTNQYSKIDNVFDPINDQFPIVYRDKKFVLKTPSRTTYQQGSVGDVWDVGGRIRDKYIIVRLTYNTTLPLELASVISTFRYSKS